MDSDKMKSSTDTDARTSRQGTNQGGMRAGNERIVLTLLRQHPQLPKAEIARRTGLSAQTVARLIKSLENDGLILRGAPSKGKIGQPSVPLSLNPEGALFIGIKVGRRSIEVIVIDLLGTIVARRSRTYSYPDFVDILDFILNSVSDLRADLPANLRPRMAGIGIGMPFFLWKWADYIGVDPALMDDWRHRKLRDEVAAQVDLPVFLQNDATSACGAEMVFGRQPLAENTLCFYVAFFIGGGIILRDSLFTGSTGNAAGFGPLIVPDLDGVSRPLIELASLSTLEDMLTDQGLDPSQIWARSDNWNIPSDLLKQWIKQCAHALAQAIVSAQTILDLELIVIDGWMPEAIRSDLSQATAKALGELDMTGMHKPSIAQGTLGPDARALGAASLPLSARFLIAD